MSNTNHSLLFDSVQDSGASGDFLVQPRKPLTKYQIDTLRRAAKILESLVRDGDVLSSPEHVRQMIKCHVSHLDYEVFGVIYVDNRHRMLAIESLFKGTIDSAAVYPREVVKGALKHSAASCFFFHNHPSGIAEPSDTDVRLTRKLVDSLAMVDVRVLDHVIAAGDNMTSLAERGLM